MLPAPHFSPTVRPAIGQLGASRIREVANSGIGREDLLAFWFGEPDTVTPEFIRAAGIAALSSGDTFYTHNLGIAPLRAALAEYLSALHAPARFSPERVLVTSSGMQALMLTQQALISPGDRVVVVTPVWPNLVEGPKILGAEVVSVPLRHAEGTWHLPLDALLDSLTDDTRALLINAPNNPTGWCISSAAQQVILAHCRQRGIWIVSDDVYERLYFQPPWHAPSFLPLALPDDRVISTNSFSKAWCMTGWRLGWIVLPEVGASELAGHFGKLIEYNVSCAPAFVQRAGMVAVREGEPVVQATRERLQAARDHLIAALQQLDGIDVTAAPGAMYSFLRVRSHGNSLDLAKRLVRETGLGLAPGIAFGPEGEGFLRWCFAASHARLDEGVRRLRRALSGR